MFHNQSSRPLSFSRGNVAPLFARPRPDGLQVSLLAAVPSVRLLRHLQPAVRGAQGLVLLGSQHALRLLVNLR